ncbi:hypothetical protein Tco_1336819 [Tanacetum coccineum]
MPTMHNFLIWEKQGNSPIEALPEDHMPNFHHYDDARDIWMAVKARFGGNEESKKMRKKDLCLKLKQLTEFSFFSCVEEARARLCVTSTEVASALPSTLVHKLVYLGIIKQEAGLDIIVDSKLTYSDQQSIVPSVYQTSGRSDNIMECVLHSFVAENEPDQHMIYEDFDQVDQLEMEELDLKKQDWYGEKVYGVAWLGLNADNGGDARVSDDASC